MSSSPPVSVPPHCIILPQQGDGLNGLDPADLGGVACMGTGSYISGWATADWAPAYYICLDARTLGDHHAGIFAAWVSGRITRLFLHGSFFDRYPDCIGTPGMLSLDQVLPGGFAARGRAQGWPDLTANPAFVSDGKTPVTTLSYALRFAAFLGHRQLGCHLGARPEITGTLSAAQEAQEVGHRLQQERALGRALDALATLDGDVEISDLTPDEQIVALATAAGHSVPIQTLGDFVAEATNTPPNRRYAAAKGRLPRLLIFDMTCMGNGTATGEIKSRLLGHWPRTRILQVASPEAKQLSLVRPDAGGGYTETKATRADAEAAIARFAPDVILYRPLPDRVTLHDLAMRTIRAWPKTPLVTWIMDDWPARLAAEEPQEFLAASGDLSWLLRRSGLRLSISDAMSRAFEARYGLPFVAFANGIDPADWPQPHVHKDGPVTLRYAGGLAPDMNAMSLQLVAQAVAARRRMGQDIRFETSTNDHWKRQSAALFDGLDGTTLETTHRPFEDYIRWLCDADILAIAYNFDDASLRYVRFSMANKVPECMASGAAILAVGPRGVATIDYLADTNVARIVGTPDQSAIEKALADLSGAKMRRTFAERARARALEHHALPTLTARLSAAIAAAPAVADVATVKGVAEVQTYLAPGGSTAFAPVAPDRVLRRIEAGDLGAGPNTDSGGGRDHVLIVSSSPRRRLARALATGHDTAPVIEALHREVALTLRLVRGLGTQATVVSAEAVGDDIGALSERLAHMGYALPALSLPATLLPGPAAFEPGSTSDAPDGATGPGDSAARDARIWEDLLTPLVDDLLQRAPDFGALIAELEAREERLSDTSGNTRERRMDRALTAQVALGRKIKSTSAEVSAQRAARREAETALSTATTEIATLRAEVTASSAAAARAEDRLLQGGAAIDEQAARLAALQADLTAATIKVAEGGAQKGENVTLKKDMDALETSLVHQRARIVELTDKVTAQDENVARQRELTAGLTEVVATRDADLARQHDDLAAAHYRIDQIMQSYSIRVTRPLRWVASILRPGRREQK